MKKICMWMALLAAALSGCQPQSGAAEVQEFNQESGGGNSEGLVEEGPITKVEAAETKGIDPVVWTGAEELAIFEDIFANAEKLPGTVNMAEPEVYLKVTNDKGVDQHLYLWIGRKGEKSTFMRADANHVIFDIPSDRTEQLWELLEQESEEVFFGNFNRSSTVSSEVITNLLNVK